MLQCVCPTTNHYSCNAVGYSYLHKPGPYASQPAISLDVAHVDGGMDGVNMSCTISVQESLNEHVHIFANGIGEAIPVTNLVNQLQR